MPPKKRKNESDNVNSGPNKRKIPDSLSSKESLSHSQFLENTIVFILPASIQKARMQIFKSNVQKYGGIIEGEITEDTTHIVIDDDMEPERMVKLLKIDSPPSPTVVKTAWLSACFRQKSKVDVTDHLFDLSHVFRKEESPGNDHSDSEEQNKDVKFEPSSDTTSKSQYAKAGMMFNAFNKAKPNNDMSDADSDYVPSGDESDNVGGVQPFSDSGIAGSSSDTTPNTSPAKQLPVGKWICAQSSLNPKPNYNKHVTEKLEQMVKNYESTNDKWRAFGYQKAIQALRRHPKEITTWEEARGLQGVGAKLADKVWEIIQSGGLRKLEEFQSNEEVKILNMFTDVWGAGPHTARVWYQQGFRSIEDLKTKANLTHQQKVGVRLYDDLLDRMPHSEAGEIEKVVREAAESIQPGIIAQACGSYRRGKSTCGDVDVLVTHPDGKSHQGVYGKLLAKLKEIGFLTDDLVSAEDNGNQKKYLGVCKLPGENKRHRRLDIIVVPYDEYGCALVYFTGSAHFNRSLRHLCKKLNMSLNEHALKTGVVRKGSEKIYEGTTIPTPTEESVFKALNVPYRPPNERDH